MNNNIAQVFKLTNIIVDFLLLNISFFLAYHLVILSGSVLENINFLNLLITHNLIWFIIASIVNYYEIGKQIAIERKFYRTFRLFLFYYIGINILIVVTKAYFIPPKFLLYFLLFFSLSLIFWKLMTVIYLTRSKKNFKPRGKIVIAGGGDLGTQLMDYIKKSPDVNKEFVGFFDDFKDNCLFPELVIGSVNDCISYSISNKITEIYCALPASENGKIFDIMYEADKHMIRVHIIPDFRHLIQKQIRLNFFGNIPVLDVREEPLENIFNRLNKRLFDFVFSLFVTIFLLSWLIPFIALIIKLTSSGPIFFMQLRSGKNNISFKCYKFRSMYLNDEAQIKQSTVNDSRITPVGKILRKYSIDELPQFLNVLMGKMSVVGPRPHMLEHTNLYSNLIDKYMVRQFLTPGITGWAQVNGFRGETKLTDQMEKRIIHDIWYLENWSLLLDFKIVLLTIANIFKGEENAI